MAQTQTPAKTTSNGPPALAVKKDFLALLESADTKSEIQRLLPDEKAADRVIRTVRTAWQLDAKLQACSPQSILSACMKACEVNLIPGGAQKHAWLIPYGNTATFQIGYLGVLELARRSGEFKSIEAVVVYEADHFEFWRDPAPHIEHRPFYDGPAGKERLFYAYAFLNNGSMVTEIMPRDVVDKIHRSSKAPNSPAWTNWFDQMGCRSVLNRLLKRQAQSTEITSAIAHIEQTEFEEGNGGDTSITVAPGQSRTSGLKDKLRQRAGSLPAPEPAQEHHEPEQQTVEVKSTPEPEVVAPKLTETKPAPVVPEASKTPVVAPEPPKPAKAPEPPPEPVVKMPPVSVPEPVVVTKPAPEPEEETEDEDLVMGVDSQEAEEEEPGATEEEAGEIIPAFALFLRDISTRSISTDDLMFGFIRDFYSAAPDKLAKLKIHGNRSLDFDLCDAECDTIWKLDPDQFKSRALRVADKMAKAKKS